MQNEKRLIWDEDAKRHLIALAVGHHSETLHIDMILNAILHHTPAVDAVEVVRCKDCKFGEPSINAIGEPSIACENIHIGFYGWLLGEDDFCSYGERKDNA